MASRGVVLFRRRRSSCYHRVLSSLLCLSQLRPRSVCSYSASSYPKVESFSSFSVHPTRVDTALAMARRASVSSSASANKSASSVRHLPAELAPSWFHVGRSRVLTSEKVDLSSSSEDKDGVVVYWMQRDARAEDNWALLLAAHLAHERGLGLHVVTALGVEDDGARVTERWASFWLGGLRRCEEDLRARGVPLEVLPPPVDGAAAAARAIERRARVVVCDASPLRRYRRWTEIEAAPALEAAGVPLYQVDAHNVVPVWIASDKREVGARTLRPRINRWLPEYVTGFPRLDDVWSATRNDVDDVPLVDWEACRARLNPDLAVPARDDLYVPGAGAAEARFRAFRDEGLVAFADKRNDPTLDRVCSGLSPWINHGHVSFQRLALSLRAEKTPRTTNGTAAFLEEGVVRRELSDNYCWYEPDHYDDLRGAAGWARESLEKHAEDAREHAYSRTELEDARTHDDLWNAAQLQLVKEGAMHGFLRMYWAKKILEWTAAGPAAALATAQYLNDRYALDGNDPNGFVGVGWSVMGVHDMGWKERDVFGKIRYMNYAGCKRKFKVAAFVAKYPPAAKHAAAVLAKTNGGPATTTTTKVGQKRKATS